MKLNSRSRYGVMALIDLMQSNQHVVSVPEIARRQDLPVPYLEQLFLKLKHAGIIKSMRGVTGGYTFSRSPDQITVFDIFTAVDPVFKTKRCQNSSRGCHANGQKCNAHDLWDYLDSKFHSIVKNITLAQIQKSGLHVS